MPNTELLWKISSAHNKPQGCFIVNSINVTTTNPIFFFVDEKAAMVHTDVSMDKAKEELSA